jgi:hypothetical protein
MLWLTIHSAFWVSTTTLLFLNWWKHRYGAFTGSLGAISGHTTNFSRHEIPFQDIHTNSYPELFTIPAPNDPWIPLTPPGSPRPILPDTSTEEDGSLPTCGHASQDPLASLTFDSPPTSPSVGVIDLRTFAQMPIQPSIHRESSPTGSRPPSDTQQTDWSDRSGAHIANSNSNSNSTSSIFARRMGRRNL